MPNNSIDEGKVVNVGTPGHIDHATLTPKGKDIWTKAIFDHLAKAKKGNEIFFNISKKDK